MMLRQQGLFSSGEIDQIEAGIITIPDGAAGTREVLKLMRKLVRMGKLDPAMMLKAQEIVRHIPGKAWMAEIRAIFNWVRSNITYRLDTNDVEVIALASIVIAKGQGDCDDMCIVLATLLESIGHPCAFRAVGFDRPGDFTHVVCMTRPMDSQRWLSLDATEPEPMGWFPPGVTTSMTVPI